MSIDEQIDEWTHFYRVCTSCGHGWWGLHCPHDGYQNPCPNCHQRPDTVKENAGGECECEFVVNVDEVKALILSETRKARTEAIASYKKILAYEKAELEKEKL